MPKIVDHDDWREEALDGVFPLFAQKGYQAVTVRHVATQLGVSVGSLYHYFKSVDELFDQMLLRRAQRDAQDAAQALANVPVPQRGAGLITFVGGRMEHFRALVLLMLDYHRARGAGGTLLAQVARSYRGSLGTLLEAPSPDATVPVLSIILGMVVHGLADSTEATAARHAPLLQWLATRETTAATAPAPKAPDGAPPRRTA